MRIEHFKEMNGEEVRRVSATVIWEDCVRPPFELYFETRGVASSDLASHPHAYLAACLVPAMHFGEKRIRIMEDICPELLNGLETNMRWLKEWSAGKMQFVQIECERRQIERPKQPRRHAGSFLSGGIDSLATLRINQLDFPRDHCASIRDCVMVHGFDIGGTARSGEELSYYDRSVAALQAIVQDAHVNLVPITSNVRFLHDDVGFWMHYFHGAALAAVAHSLTERLWRMSVGSSFNIPIPAQWGSHPLLDANYGSSELQIRHDGLNLTRLQKVRLVADWDIALRNLRVCTMNPNTELNCGVCEKCVRTMLELLAVDRLEAAESFPVRHLHPDSLEMLSIHADYQVAWYRELLDPLATKGHQGIVRVLQVKLAEYDAHRKWEREEDWKGAVKRFDRRFLGSGLYRSWKVLRPNVQKMLGKTQDR